MPSQIHLADSPLSAEIEHAMAQGLCSGNYAVIITDHSKTDEPVAYVNQAFEDLTGYKLAELIGLHPKFLTKESEQKGVKELELAIRTGRAGSAIISTLHKDKTPLWFKVNVTPVYNKNGVLTHFFGSLKDVTALTNDAATEESRDIFLAKLAHDLKTPLTGADRLFALIIDGFFGVSEPELQKTLILLSNNNKKALDLVMNLLESYRLNKGVELMHFETLELSTLIEQCVQEVESTIMPRRLKIRVKVSNGLSPLEADRLAISRLITNLLDNAVKFTPEGGKVQISAATINGDVVLKITDTGAGIPEQDKDFVFEKCKRSKIRDRYTPGCGLGLYICREIVKVHQGQISFKSLIGVGTMFTVRLPIVQQETTSLDTTVS